MKTIKVSFIARITDELYENEFVEMKNDILSGKYQREIKDCTDRRKRGMKDIKVTFEIIK